MEVCVADCSVCVEPHASNMKLQRAEINKVQEDWKNMNNMWMYYSQTMWSDIACPKAQQSVTHQFIKYARQSEL